MRSPPKSPDLNPIELVWADMKKFVRKQRCKTINDVIKAVKHFWKKLTPKYCTNFINHLKKVNIKI